MIHIKGLGVCLYKLELDLRDLHGKSTKDFPWLCGFLLALLPSLRSHRCTSGREGGFIHEVEIGTELSHVIEHIILELEHVADPHGAVYSGWTRRERSESGDIIEDRDVIHFEVRSIDVATLAAETAVEVVNYLIQGRLIDLRPIIEKLKVTHARITNQPLGAIS